MKTENINHAFLDGVLSEEHDDINNHYGVSSPDPVMESMHGSQAGRLGFVRVRRVGQPGGAAASDSYSSSTVNLGLLEAT